MRGGRARWVTSPLLSQQDLEALSKASELEESPNCIDSLLRTVSELQTALETDTLNTMAWMVADGLLEFRFAIPVGKLDGDFHDKFGVFRDEFGQRVSFLGSYNDTARGFRNYESIRVFLSWEPSMVDAVVEDEQRFARIWLGREHNLRIYRLPEAVRRKILTLRSDDRPYPPPPNYPWDKVSVSLPDITPRAYQKEAITAWEENGRRGILDMATGTGKTIVALSAIARCSNAGFVIVGAPTQPLVTQWIEELGRLDGIHPPIEISSNNPDWYEEVLPRLRLGAANQSPDRPFVFVGTYHSLAGERFQSMLDKAVPEPNAGLLIADEVHNAGAPTFQRVLSPHFSYRLGLTATLERAFDAEGTQALLDYFDGVVFRMTLADAIGEVLCHYKYEVHFAQLSEEEFEHYQDLTRKIGWISSESEEHTTAGESNKDLDKLLFKRARIVKLAQNKSELLREIITRVPISRCLIYCADLEQVEAVQFILTEARIPHLPFTSRENNDQREAALRQLAQDEIAAVVAIDCLDEGIDVPQVHQAILLASSTSTRQFIQRRGRILRMAEGKEFAHLIDIFTVPPQRFHEEPPALLFSELRRARVLAAAAENKYEAELALHRELDAFGVPIEETLGPYDTLNAV